jgi:hypothetical protein
MKTIEIARNDWPKALDAFNGVHQGWLVSLDILSAELGAQPEVKDLPLIGITVEPDDEAAVMVAVGRSPADHITHSIHAPVHIWLERTDAGADAALQIESMDGTKAIVRLKTPALPETVDGVGQWP